jgi:predicted O-methyltransferase YrrM
MAFLVELTDARKAVEVGTFTGYSALCVAQALPADGALICCDVSEEWTAVGKKYWE